MDNTAMSQAVVKSSCISFWSLLIAVPIARLSGHRPLSVRGPWHKLSTPSYGIKNPELRHKADLCTRSAVHSLLSYSHILVPVNRRIRRTGLRLRAEAQVLQKEVNHGEYTSYGPEDGVWRHYINQRLPNGVASRCSQRFRSQRFRAVM